MKRDQLTKLARKFKVWLEQQKEKEEGQLKSTQLSPSNLSGEIDIETELPAIIQSILIDALDEQIRSWIESDNPFALCKWIYEELVGKEPTRKGERRVRKNTSEVIKKISEIYQEINTNNPNLEKVKKELLEIQIKDKKRELKQLKTALKSKLDENLTECLETLLEAKISLTQTDIPFIRNQFNKAQEKLSSILNEEEINNICEIQVELSKLEREWESYQAEKMEAKMEV